MRVTIEKIAYGGDGVARPGKDEPIVFVPRTAAGDVADVEVVEEKPRFRRARLSVVDSPGAGRVAPACGYYARESDDRSCGGCQYQHLSYDAQLAAKVGQLDESLRRIGGFAGVAVRAPIAADAPLGYRNKGTFRWSPSAGAFGLIALDGRTVIPVESCPLLSGRADRVYRACDAAARALAKESPAFRDGALSLVVREGVATGETLAGLVTRDGFDAGVAKDFAARVREATEVTSFAWGASRRADEPMREVRWQTIAGARAIHERIGGLTFVLDAETFFQVNTPQAERLYAKAIDYAGLTGKESCVDLYCGNGGLTLTAARRAKRVIGVEVVRAAVDRGIEASKLNDLPNARFERGDAEDMVKKLVHSLHLKPDVVFLDPPRAGLKSGMPKQIAKLGAKRVVYVSCNPATLARDLKAFGACGYDAREVTPVDLFPQTFHLEAVALLEKR